MTEIRGLSGRIVFAMTVGLALGACAASAPPQPAAAPAAAVPPATPAERPMSSVSEEVPTTAKAESAAAASEAEASAGASRTEAFGEWRRAQAELQAAANDCVRACQALASMERAVVHLCALAEEPDDRRRCEGARKQVLEARTRVRLACGTCPGGPSLDRNAPIPSR
jgi:hypothetical protein